MPTVNQLVEHSQKKLEEFAKLPIEELTRKMVEWGIINENGDLLWNAHLNEYDPLTAFD